MFNDINSENQKKKNKKLIGIGLLAIAVLVITGIVLAYYSDMIEQSGDVVSGTLKINGTYNVYLNDTATQLDNITSLNPGDVIVVKGSVTNTGNQSAWIREKFTVEAADATFFSYLKFYDIELTQADLMSEVDYSGNLLAITAGEAAVSGNRVINGNGPEAQTESGSDYDYLGRNSYDFAVTIYFMHTAPNVTQGKTFTLTVATQALQFKNNNAEEPGETAWDAVTPA